MLNIYRYETDREALKKQLERSVTFEPEVERTVHDILAAVRSGGDKALLDYTERFQGVRLQEMTVSGEEIRRAYEQADSRFIGVLEEAYRNITAFHRHEIEKSFSMKQRAALYSGSGLLPWREPCFTCREEKPPIRRRCL